MTFEVTVTSTSPEETRRIGERLAERLRAGDVVLLSGELGAGKTVFVQGIAHGLGFEGQVSSKSFVLMGEYPGRVKLYHADLYRLEAPEEVEELALEEVAADGVLVVEWPERAGEDLLPEEHLRIEFDVTGERERVLRARGRGARPRELAASVEEQRDETRHQ